MRGTRGFSLIESMVAVALFAVGLAALFQCFHLGGKTARHERLMATAVHVAEQVMEDMLQRHIDDPDLKNGRLFCFDTVGQAVTDCFADDVFEVMVELTDTEVPGLFTLKTTALWREQGARHQLSFTTRRY